MLDARSYTNGEVTPLPVSEISDRVDAPGCLLWVDALDPDPGELHELAQEFSLHPLALEGALQRGERPKLERYPTHRFIVAYTAALARVALFLGPNWVLSVHFAHDQESTEGHQRAPWDPSVARERFEALDSKHDVGRLVYSIIDELVDGYEARTDELSDCVEAIEDCVLEADADTSTGVEKDVLAVRRDLLKFRRVVVPLRDVVQDVLRSRSPDDAEALIALNDVHDHILRVVDQLDALRELLGNAFDAHLAGVSNQMNLVMKKLTAWGSIVFGATLIAGIYGMNFEHMPELGWWFGYPMALGLMLLLSAVLYTLFKRKKWL